MSLYVSYLEIGLRMTKLSNNNSSTLPLPPKQSLKPQLLASLESKCTLKVEREGRFALWICSIDAGQVSLRTPIQASRQTF